MPLGDPGTITIVFVAHRVPAAIVAAIVVTSLTSCRGDDSPGNEGRPGTVDAPPAATEAAPAPSSPATATPTPTPTPTRTPTATPTPRSPPNATPAEDPAADIAAIRTIVVAYWEAFNDWDADRALSMLEPAYRAGEDPLIRRDIARLEQFGVRLDVSEDTPPTLNDAGDYETYVTMVTPIDTLRLRMVFRRIDGAWWIVFSGVVLE